MKRRILALFCLLLLMTTVLPIGAMAAEGDVVKIISDKYGEGLIPYKNSKNKFGYVNTAGKVVISAKYNTAYAFHNGLAMVKFSSGTGYEGSQFIDRSGNVVIPNLGKTSKRYYAYSDKWFGDYAMVEIWEIKQGGSISPIGFNYANKNGKLLNGEEYKFVGPFSEGYALVGTGSSYGKLTRYTSSKDNTQWMQNSSGKAVSEYFYIDMAGRRLGSLTWADGRPFQEGMAAVAVQGSSGTMYWGFIDSNGNLQVSPEYEVVGNFINGLAQVSDGEKCGYIDKTGKVVIPLIWESVSPFDEDGYAVVKDEYYAHIIDRAGNVVLETEYNNMVSIPGTGRYLVNDGFASGMIDREGNLVVPTAYKNVNGRTNVIIATRYDDALMIVNEFGEIITPVIRGGERVTAADSNYKVGDVCKKVTFGTTVNDIHWDMCFFTDEQANTLSLNMRDAMRGETFTIDHSNGKTVLFSLNGKRIGDTEWDGYNSAASNQYVVCVKKKDFYGFVDPVTGFTLVNPQYTSVTAAEDGTLIAMLGNNPVYLDNHARPLK